jgi:Na+/H+ antiporter NhaD/arsenite permease-like protein
MIRACALLLVVFSGMAVLAADGAHAAEAIGSATAAAVAVQTHGPAVWAILPFVVLLAAIAAGPLLLPRFWHHHYPKVSIGLGLLTAVYYLLGIDHGYTSLVHAAFEYSSFIALLAVLFCCAGGIVISVGKPATPMANVSLLLIGALLANIIGTTGASIVLIRPWLRMNRGRIKPFHVVFFIFVVSNVAGSLTPIGDPPLFLGYLLGIDFFLFGRLNGPDWILAIILLCIIFWFFDRRVPVQRGTVESGDAAISIAGWRSIGLLMLAVCLVFVDPSKIAWLPAVIDIGHGQSYTVGIPATVAAAHPGLELHGFSFVRELLQLALAWFALRLAHPRHLQANGFEMGPIKEVALLFVGIFLTMIPALQLIRQASADGLLPVHPTALYFSTGVLSSVLDNAPTFMAFLASIEGKTGLSPQQMSAAIQSGTLDPALQQQVLAAMQAKLATATGQQAEMLREGIALLNRPTDFVAYLAQMLTAISVAAVFWGAMTYIGNGPNFMVKAIAESAKDEQGRPVVSCPSFFGYILCYSLPILLPVLLVVWLVTFSPWRIL